MHVDRKIVPFLIATAALGVPLLFCWRFMDPFHVPKEVLVRLVGILILSLWAFCFLGRDGHSLKVSPVHLPVAVLLLWTLLSLCRTSSLISSLGYLSVMGAGVACCLATVRFVENGRERSLILAAVVAAGVAASVVGILQYFGADLRTWDFSLDLSGAPPGKLRMYSTFGNANFLAAYLAAVIPVSLAAAGSARRAVARAGCGICAAVMLVALFLTRTKGGWLGAAAGIVFLFIGWAIIIRREPGGAKRRMARAAAAAALLCVVGLAVVGFSARGRVALREARKSFSISDSSQVSRFLMWKTGLLMVREHPVLGLGPGRFDAHYQPYQGRVLELDKDGERYYPILGVAQRAHNDYIQTAAEIGLAGLAAFLWLLWRSLRIGKGIIGGPSGSGEALRAAGLLAGIGGMLVHALVSSPLHLVGTQFLLWLFIGLLASQREARGGAGGFHFRVEGAKRVLGRAGVCVAAALLAACAIRPAVGSGFQRDAWLMMGEGHWRAALPLAGRGVRWDPANYDMHIYRGTAYYHIAEYVRGLDPVRREQEPYPDHASLYRNGLASFQRAHGLYRDYMALYNMGLCYQRLGQHDRAEERFLEAARYFPTFAEAYDRLAESCQMQGRVVDSVRYRGQANRLRGSSGHQRDN